MGIQERKLGVVETPILGHDTRAEGGHKVLLAQAHRAEATQADRRRLGMIAGAFMAQHIGPPVLCDYSQL